MSKSQEQEAPTQESIDNIRQQLNEEYKNLTWVQVGYLALGAETGNKKYDKLNKQLGKNKFELVGPHTSKILEERNHWGVKSR